jgi:lipopolysaccharide biosynthesis glycosyltransferase
MPITGEGTGAPRHLAVASDATYLPWCATAVLSVLRSRTRGVVVHLLHATDVSGSDLDRFGAMVRTEGAQLVPLAVADLDLGPLPPAVAAHGGAVSCARLLLPDVLTHVDRLVYLDADTLTRQPLDELWELSLGGAVLGAVRNVVEPSMAARLTALGVADPRRYLNSGVLVMDLAAMRREGTAATLLRCVHERGAELLWVDQDALNLVLGDGWHELDPKWNAQNSFWDWPQWAQDVLGADAVEQARSAPAVLHFEGPWMCKPWHFLCRHEYTETYRALLAQTPWAGAPLTDRTAATRAIGQLPRAWQVDAYLRLLRGRARVRRALRRG